MLALEVMQVSVKISAMGLHVVDLTLFPKVCTFASLHSRDV